MSEETTTTTTTDNAASESAAPVNPSADIGAALQSSALEPQTSVVAESATAAVAAEEKSPEPAVLEGVDPAVVEWAKREGYDPVDLSDPKVLAVATKAQAAEKARADLETEHAATKTQLLERDSSAIAQALMQAHESPAVVPVADLSPLQEIERDYGDALAGLAYVKGLDVNDPEFVASADYQAVIRSHDADVRQAQALEIEYQINKRLSEQSKQAEQQQAEARVESQKAEARAILAELEAAEPKLKEMMIETGVAARIKAISERYGISVVDLLSDRAQMAEFAADAKARYAAAHSGEARKQHKQEVLAELAHASPAQLPAQGNPIPPSVRALAIGELSGIGKGVSVFN